MDHDVFIPAGAQWRPGAHDRLCSLPVVTRYKPLLSTLNADVDISYPGLSRVFPLVAQEESGTQRMLYLSQKYSLILGMSMKSWREPQTPTLSHLQQKLRD